MFIVICLAFLALSSCHKEPPRLEWEVRIENYVHDHLHGEVNLLKEEIKIQKFFDDSLRQA